jgi:2-amino-4-hydroxy-6-hydroxymethyldihydropteridine diphosphokinase
MSALWRPAYIALGSNLDEPREQVLAACERIGRLPATRIEARSRLYSTRPMGPQDQSDFINAAVGVVTQLSPKALLEGLLAIERQMGRVRREQWGPRIIDLDLVWMVGAVVEEPGLSLPHPGVSSRNFVLYPLSDIAPTLDIPGHGRVLQLKARSAAEGISVVE